MVHKSGGSSPSAGPAKIVWKSHSTTSTGSRNSFRATSVLFLIGGAILQPVDWLPDFLSYPLFWIYLNQTLIAGCFAVLIGWLTVKAIRRQISLQKELEDERRRRSHLATVSGLTLTFSEIIEYAEACWHSSIRMLQKWQEYQEWDRTSTHEFQLGLPQFPFDAFREVQKAIETAEPEDAKKLAELLSFAQIQNSRLASLAQQFFPATHDQRSVIVKPNVYRAARDALEIRFRASRCLTYARQLSQHIDNLPDFSAVEEFLFFVSTQYEGELREYLKATWHQHWASERTTGPMAKDLRTQSD